MKNILKVQNKNDSDTSGKHVGVMMPQHVTNYLSLFALAQKGTKSRIVRELIDDWYSDKRVEQTEDDLIDKIARSICEAWLSLKQRSPNIPFAEFGRSLKEELSQKGIDEMSINLIIKKIADEAEKETN